MNNIVTVIEEINSQLGSASTLWIYKGVYPDSVFEPEKLDESTVLKVYGPEKSAVVDSVKESLVSTLQFLGFSVNQDITCDD